MQLLYFIHVSYTCSSCTNYLNESSCDCMITTKVLLHKSALKVEVHLLMYQSGAEYLMEVVCVEDKNIQYIECIIVLTISQFA